VSGAPLRIGDVARLVGTTPRTIRYYEELGLLPAPSARPSGQHRTYTADEVERLREVMRLKNLLGVTLEELKTLLSAEEARAAVRVQLRRDDVHPERRRELLAEALGHIERQLRLVDHRAAELAKLKDELGETRKRVRRKIRELDAHAGGAFPPAVPEPQKQAESRRPSPGARAVSEHESAALDPEARAVSEHESAALDPEARAVSEHESAAPDPEPAR
jgi:MerR family transcriptional regulator, repressor of the yfmOP operon